MASVGVLGLGAMGGRIARRLLEAGHEVSAWNRSPQKAEALVEAGARPASSPAEVAERVDVVLTMLADPDALMEVVTGSQGLASAGGSFTLVEMSTVGPDAIQQVVEALPDDVEVLDAPVLGSLSEVEAGSLQIFVGGSKELFERWSPLLSELGSPLHVGGLGAGAAAKLVVNSTLLGVLGVLGEALALARGQGLTEETALRVLESSPLGAQVERRRPAIESGDYPLRFRLALARKDAQLVVDTADSAGVDARLAAAVLAWLTDADESGWGDRDYSSILEHISRAPRA